jgi:hypothetical protein
MASHAGWRWGRRLAGVALPLLVIVLATPATARASCGDYVVLGSGPGHSAGRPTMATQRHESMPSIPVPTPCSGPGCNRGTPLPLPAPATISSLQGEDWVCLPDRLLPTDAPIVTRLQEQPAPATEGHLRSIYHPPRPHHA